EIVLKAESNLTGITRGPDKIVAVGDKGSIYISANGTDYTPQSSGTSADLTGVTYGNSTYAAVGVNGTILTSPDGLNWTNQISGTTFPLHEITYGDSTFVIVGGYGTILTSPSGTNWTSHLSGISDCLFGITYGNNTFVAVGNNSIILQSSPVNNNNEITANIYKNWNLLSLPVIPASTSPQQVFGEQWDKVVSIWKWGDSNWQVALPSLSQEEAEAYRASKGYEALEEITSCDGFWVNSGNQFQLLLKGDVPVNTFPNLTSGWNLVGLCGNSTKTVDQIVEAIDLDIQSIWKWPEGDGSWKVCLPGENDNGTSYAQNKGFGLMEQIGPGQGFWVNCQ
ncbi:MAG: hypothetical protein K9J81_11655, partial [Desulfohalobiaceae bacterium]|nr:hypothetical protein [Desulfohalobiaceae bacterium]